MKSTKLNKKKHKRKNKKRKISRSYGIVSYNEIKNTCNINQQTYNYCCDETIRSIKTFLSRNSILAFNIKNYKTRHNVDFTIKISNRFPNAGNNFRISNIDRIEYSVPFNRRGGYNSSYVYTGTSGNDKIVNLYKCNNNGIVSYRFGTKITFDPTKGFNNITTQEFSNLIRSIPDDKNKKIILISLLTPCTGLLCGYKDILSYLIPKLQIFFTENEVLRKEMEIENMRVISVPLSTNKKFGLTIYDSKFTSEKQLFELIVGFTKDFYEKHRHDSVVLFHCKSGKDRTSVFDAIFQSTIFYITKTGRVNFEEIRKLTQKFLVFGLILSYYGTGNIGLKLRNIPLAYYILDDLLENYVGDSDNFESSG